MKEFLQGEFEYRMLKLSENPPFLCPKSVSLQKLDGTWWVAHTKSRQEKAFAWDLLRRNIGYFLPYYEKVTLSGGRKRKVLMPLFPSYVFLCGSEEERYTAMTTNRLCMTIDVPDPDQLVRELLFLEKAMKGKEDLDPFPEIAEGALCRVKAGPYKGMEGVVIKKDGKTNIVLEVTIIGQAAKMEIDPNLVERID